MPLPLPLPLGLALAVCLPLVLGMGLGLGMGQQFLYGIYKDIVSSSSFALDRGKILFTSILSGFACNELTYVNAGGMYGHTHTHTETYRDTHTRMQCALMCAINSCFIDILLHFIWHSYFDLPH